MKILLVEDDPKISSFIRIGPESHECIVDVAYDSLFGEKLNDTAGVICISASLQLKFTTFPKCRKSIP